MAGVVDSLAARANALGRGLDRSLALLAAIAFITQIGVAVMLPLLPLYAQNLGATPRVLGLLTSSFALTNAAGQLAAGFIAQRVGPRRLVPAGMGLYAGANALIATATAALPLIAWRSIAGLGAGLGLVSERLYLSQVVDRARLAFGNGLLSAAGSAGTVAGPAVGGILASTDLRLPFLLVAVTSALAAGAALFLPRPRTAETAAAAAADELEVVASRRILGTLLAANVALLAGFGAFITTYAPFATTELGWSRAEIGILFALFGLGSIVVGPWLGNLADRRGRRPIAILACVPIVAFVLILVTGAPQGIVFAAAIVAGGAIAGFEAAWYALLVTATGGVRGGRLFGTISALSTLGIVIGANAAANLWELVDIHAGVLVVAVAAVAAGVAMFVFPATFPAEPGPSEA
jgi:MFS transporter, DHA1 family, multidrug resistance protein